MLIKVFRVVNRLLLLIGCYLFDIMGLSILKEEGGRRKEVSMYGSEYYNTRCNTH